MVSNLNIMPYNRISVNPDIRSYFDHGRHKYIIQYNSSLRHFGKLADFHRVMDICCKCIAFFMNTLKYHFPIFRLSKGNHNFCIFRRIPSAEQLKRHHFNFHHDTFRFGVIYKYNFIPASVFSFLQNQREQIPSRTAASVYSQYHNA